MTHVRQWGLVLGVGVVYTLLRAWAAPEDPTVAVVNADTIVAAERAIGLFFEDVLQSTILTQDWLVWLINAYYVHMHVAPVLGVLVFTYVRRPDWWPLVRDAWLLFTAAGLMIHIFFPVAPPWFLDGLGLHDTVQGPGAEATWKSSGLGNTFAAMPSMHWGWATIAGAALYVSARHPALKAAGAAHPVVMAVAIVATGNHYILDAVASAVLVIAALVGVLVMHGWPEDPAPSDAPDDPPTHPPSNRPS